MKGYYRTKLDLTNHGHNVLVLLTNYELEYNVEVYIRKKLNQEWKRLEVCFRLLDANLKERLVRVLFAQFVMAILDLLGVLLVGIVGTISAGKILGENSNPVLDKFLSTFKLQNLSLTIQVITISTLALLILTVRSIITIYLSKKTLRFLSQAAGQMTVDLFDKLTLKPSFFIRSKREQEFLFALTNGPQTIILGVVFSVIAIATDLFMVIVMMALMVFVQPFTAISTLLFFGLIGLTLHLMSNGKIREYGAIETASTLSVQESILETLSVYEQLQLRNNRKFLREGIKVQRRIAADSTSELQFLPSISKYLLESSIVIGGFLVAGIQFLVSNVTGAVTALAIFVVSASRIAPSVMRVQQNLGVLNGSLSRMEPYATIINEIFTSDSALPEQSKQVVNPELNIVLKNVDFSYGSKSKPEITQLNLDINFGDFIALIGPSGAGKSTIAKLILGLLKPTNGRVQIGGVDPELLYTEMPGSLGYVPQEVTLIRGGILENVTLGESSSKIDLKLAEECLRRVGLFELYKSHRNTPIARLELSGGQKQRLGIASSLYTKPKILVLDEPTSALDVSMERSITTNIYQRNRQETLIVIAHRLQTIVQADCVYYVNNGKIEAQGQFEDVKRKIPDILKQAEIIGI